MCRIYEIGISQNEDKTVYSTVLNADWLKYSVSTSCEQWENGMGKGHVQDLLYYLHTNITNEQVYS